MKFKFKTTKNENGTTTVEATGTSEFGHVFKGKAVCSPADEFMFCIGATIAETRARKKQVKKILENELKRRERFETLQKKSDREVDKLVKELKILDEIELMYSV